LLDRINAERRERQQDMLAQAEMQLPTFDPDRPSPPALVLFDEAWHPGIVGLVASRMKDAAHRPTLAFAPAEPGSPMLRGSARSIPGFHVRDALAAVDARHPGLIERFGGHAMAAGLSLARASLEACREAFEAEAARALDPSLLQAELASDGPLAPVHLSRELALALREAGPWGQGFAAPVFDNRFRVHEWRVLGERHLKFTLEHEDGGARVPAIHFGGWAGQAPPVWLHAAYQLALDDYRGREGVQLLLLHWTAA
jgi:single-stranded-DNA-specific exonuclease